MFIQKGFWRKCVGFSAARNDLAFNDQNYWSGRYCKAINCLVYLGFTTYGSPGMQYARHK